MSEIHLAITEILEGNAYYSEDKDFCFALEYYLEQMEIDFILYINGAVNKYVID